MGGNGMGRHVTASLLPFRGRRGVLRWAVGSLLAAVLPVSARPSDLASLPAVVDAVRRRFADWNLVIVAITTSWLPAAAGLAAALVGVVPGAFYAILVSAHACAALSPDCSAR